MLTNYQNAIFVNYSISNYNDFLGESLCPRVLQETATMTQSF